MSTTNTARSIDLPKSLAASPGLIVHDDLELRLKVADLLRRAGASRRFDSATQSDFAAMAIAEVRRYAALFLVLEFAGGAKADAFLALSRLRDQAPRLPIFVIARGGNERSAVQAVKTGATDYWPIHDVQMRELSSALRVIDALHQGEPAPPRAAAAQANTPADSNSYKIPGYRFVKPLSKSAAGAVYLAESSDSAALVALKLQRIADVSTDYQQRFLRECELLSKLNHRSVADVIDFGVTPDCCYLVLEYFPCGSLRERLRNPLSEAEAVSYALQIGDALRVVHAAQIVHRDLKPSNLMLTDDNRLVMIDFGLARSGTAGFDITHADISLGSPYYVSPEQIDGQEPDARCDLYSFGVVIYEMLTGDLPYKGRNVAEIVEKHRSAPVPRLPPALDKYQVLLDRLLAKNPIDRYASAQEVVASLRSFSANPASRRTST